MADGSDPSTLNTHQPLDMLHEEIIRLELLSLDRNRLKRNAETGRMERDPEVFTQAARLLGFFGESFVKMTEASNSTTRKYDKYYKQVLLIRSQLRSSGFLADYANPGLPFFSSDLKKEMHPQLHNFKRYGEEKFEEALDHLAAGKGFDSLMCSPQPKTLEEAEKILRRSELSKDDLHQQAMLSVKEALLMNSSDQFLLSAKIELMNKKAHSFNPKKSLIDYCNKIHQYIENLNVSVVKELLIDDFSSDDEV